jgi:hypothetical protein
LLVASKQMDELSGRLLMGFSNSFFEPYGISDGETFLSAAGAEIVTARFDEERGRLQQLWARRDLPVTGVAAAKPTAVPVMASPLPAATTAAAPPASAPTAKK